MRPRLHLGRVVNRTLTGPNLAVFVEHVNRSLERLAGHVAGILMVVGVLLLAAPQWSAPVTAQDSTNVYYDKSSRLVPSLDRLSLCLPLLLLFAAMVRADHKTLIEGCDDEQNPRL